jgi:hypothetical protein
MGTPPFKEVLPMSCYKVLPMSCYKPVTDVPERFRLSLAFPSLEVLGKQQGKGDEENAPEQEYVASDIVVLAGRRSEYATKDGRGQRGHCQGATDVAKDP